METDSPEAKDHVETLRRLNDDCIKSVVHVDERCRLRSAGPGGLARCDGAADEVGYYTGKRRLPGETEQERLGLVRGCNFPPAQTYLRFHLQGESLALRDAVCDHHFHAYAACAPGVSPCGGRYHMVMESSLIRHEDRHYTGIRMSQTLVL